MNINQFIEKCKYHNWDYRSSTSPEIVYLAKKAERELFIAIKQNPEWVEIYYGYRDGIFKTA